MSDCGHVPKVHRRGVLVALEGIDGAGKTTQAARLADALSSGGHDVVRTKEPTDGTWGRKLRASALQGRLSAAEELRLFLKDRKEHVRTLIKPALEAGKIVIVDRYYFSTAAYQGARGMDPAELISLNEKFAPRPDLLIFLDVDPGVGIKRIGQRGDKANDFEQEDSLRAVAQIFRALDLPYMVRIDGTLPISDITSGVLELLYNGPLSTRDGDDVETYSPKHGRILTNGDLWMETSKIR